MISPRILFVGDPVEAFKYVGVAKKFGRSTFDAGILSKVWHISDQVVIRVNNNILSKICKVWIEAGEALGYQFYGSEGTLYKTFEDPNIPGRWLPLGNWVLVKPKIKGDEVVFTSKPLLSSLRDSDDDKWVYNPNPYLSIQPGVEDILYLTPMHQPDGLCVKKWQSVNLKSQWLASVWAEPTPNHAVHWSSGSVTYYWNTNITDQGFDYPPVVYRGKKGKRQAPNSDWWRGACLNSVVSDEFGSRTFIIMVDIKHQFYCYPTGVYDPESELPNVDNDFVKTAIAPLPDWVTIYDVGMESAFTVEEHNQAVQPQWVFSPDGDKAAAVMFHKEEPWSNTTITSHRYVTDDSVDLQENYPGVVEMEFDVQITGENAEDFTFTITNTKDLYSKDTGVGYVAVGYAATDLPNGVLYNELLILKHRYFISNMFYPCTYFDTDTLFDDTPSVLISPAIAVVAEVVKEDDTVVMTWLSSYTAEFGYYQNKVGLTESSLINPTFSSISDKPDDDNGTRQLCFHTAINSMDLSTLTLCFGSSLTIVGKTTSYGFSFSLDYTPPLFYTYRCPFCASAAYVSLYSLGILDEERWVGHNDLKVAVKEYFTLVNPVLNLAAMTEVNLKATIDSESIVVPQEESPAKCWDLYILALYRTVTVDEWAFDLQTMYANITLTTGTGIGDTTKEVVFASATNFMWDGLIESQHGPNGLAEYYLQDKNAYMVWIPRIFTFFDGHACQRPGLRWTEKELVDDFSPPTYRWHGINQDPREYILETGDTSYTGYPLGIILHTRFTNIAVYPLNNVYANLSAEPNGSYATFFGPFAAPTSTVLTHANLDNQLPNFSAFELEQNFIDVIKVRLPGKNGDYVEGKTSHLSEMNTAYDITLTYNDYVFDVYQSGSQLFVKHQILVPDDPGYIAIGNLFDNNYGFLPESLGYNKFGQVGGSIFFSPLAVGWNKTFQGNGVDYTQYQTMPVFEYLELQTFQHIFEVSRPTPRMEGMFTRLPIAKDI